MPTGGWVAIVVLAATATIFATLYLTRDSSSASPAPGGGAVPASSTAQRDGWIPSGTYKIPDEIPPGVYRVGRDYSIRDAATEENLALSMTTEGPTVMVITDATPASEVEITGGAWPLEAGGPVDPMQFRDGTYVVGFDIEPGTYRVTAAPNFAGIAYAARVDENNEVITNELADLSDTADASVTIVIAPTDFAFDFTGLLEKVD